MTQSVKTYLLAWCDVLTVTLHATHDDALEAKRIIDFSYCGGRCTGRHEIVKLAPTEIERVLR